MKIIKYLHGFVLDCRTMVGKVECSQMDVYCHKVRWLPT